MVIRCKGRVFCLSCWSQRVHDTAFHLAEHVLPEAPCWQWVLSSYPCPVQMALARSGPATALLLFTARRDSLAESAPGIEALHSPSECSVFAYQTEALP